MNPLPTELRNKLERTIIQARDIAEAGAKAALEALAVHHHEPYSHMSPEERKLRNQLRARARQLGDKQNRKGELEIIHLVWECAYEHWHRMLFARFLAENDLLIEPEMGIAISLEECEELANEDGRDLWTLASEFAQRMLPQIFRPNDPVLRIALAREYLLKLERFLNDLEPLIFTASDSLGWVYQFWQSKRKKEVNQSGNKIGADELPAVTQLFTEPYMVSFLLDNSLGAWWATKRLTKADLKNAKSEEELRRKASLHGVPLKYLRFVRLENGTWTPAAGTYNSWPKHLSKFKVLDPCCGSGHFLVAAFLMIVPIRMELEGLSARDACDAVLRENLHGLEIDKRCVELAAFAMALTAWNYPDDSDYRPLPVMNLACSGLAINARREEWHALSRDNTNLRMTLENLYKQFKEAPLLGSLINPDIGLAKGSLFELKWEEVGPLLSKALSIEKDDDKTEMGVVIHGVAKAATLLTMKYNWVITNVPYRSRNDLNTKICNFIDSNYENSKGNIATVFIERCIELLNVGGTIAIVTLQDWLFQPTYKKLRKKLLKRNLWNFVGRLGAQAFQTPLWDFNVQLLLMTKGKSIKTDLQQISKKSNYIRGFDVSHFRSAGDKAELICVINLDGKNQEAQLDNPDAIVTLREIDMSALLSIYASSRQGISPADTAKYGRRYWELPFGMKDWYYWQGTTRETLCYSGRDSILWFGEELKNAIDNGIAYLRGEAAFGKRGIAISPTGTLCSTLYTGEYFDDNVQILVPHKEKHVAAIWAYCSSGQYNTDVREIDQALKVRGALVKVPFDLDHWSKIAKEKYPNGLPKPYSDDPTQWIFHGHPAQSEHQLQVAVGRLLGYRWPAELDAGVELADEQREWVTKCDGLFKYADEDGIVCIPSIRGEEAADSRLRTLLTFSLGPDWSQSAEQKLIEATGSKASNSDEWLRDHFFEQHCKLFHHRPFIWHIWDGRRRDGFHALVNYHKLAEGNGKGRQLLESLTYSYLGDWIIRQKEGVRLGEGGAEDRLAAAIELQKRLIAIIEGEPPFDIFVRWKPIEKQPIGWEPDINDGVRLNIRPFMARDIQGGRKGSGILRWKPNIKWNKDRGKEPLRSKEQYPWFWKDDEFTGDRVNNIHLTNEDKRHTREKAKNNN